MIARVQQDPDIDRPSATLTLPVISFEMGTMVYDGDRKLPTTNRSVVKDAEGTYKYQYNPVPYNISFKVFVYAKNAEDGTRIVEQALPFFTPAWTQTVELIPEMEERKDIVITLNNIEYSDTYDSKFEERRAIVWTLDLTLKGYFYGPVKKSAIIKFVKVPFRIPGVPDGQLDKAVGNTAISEMITVQPGLTANGQPINYYGKPAATGTVPYTEINENDDFGFITQIYSNDELG